MMLPAERDKQLEVLRCQNGAEFPYDKQPGGYVVFRVLCYGYDFGERRVRGFELAGWNASRIAERLNMRYTGTEREAEAPFWPMELPCAAKRDQSNVQKANFARPQHGGGRRN